MAREKVGLGKIGFSRHLKAFGDIVNKLFALHWP